MFKKMKLWAKKLKKQIFILYVSYKDPRVKWYSKLFVAIVVAYAFSPIDLIPDFIPLLGVLDDIILVPLGIYFSLKILPPAVIKDATAKVESMGSKEKPRNWLAGIFIIVCWFIIGIWVLSFFLD